MAAEASAHAVSDSISLPCVPRPPRCSARTELEYTRLAIAGRTRAALTIRLSFPQEETAPPSYCRHLFYRTGWREPTCCCFGWVRHTAVLRSRQYASPVVLGFLRF